MKILVLDFETSDTLRNKKRNPSPFLPENFLVSFGYETHGYDTDNSGYHFLNHRDWNDDNSTSVEVLKRLLDDCELLIAYNAKFEMEWLLETGFKYSGQVYCPMVVEYLLACGQSVSLDLDSSAERRGTQRKLGELVDTYWSKGISFDKMPMDIVETYGRRDVTVAWELYLVQQELLQTDKYKSLNATVKMSNEFLWVLVDMERNGIHVDLEALEDVKKTFTEERDRLQKRLKEIAKEAMGEMPINLDSPEQLSWLLYSRKVKDKKDWKEFFNVGTDSRGKRLKPPRLSQATFLGAVRSKTTVLKQTRSVHCLACSGRGMVDRLTASGNAYKRMPKCQSCGGLGYTLEDQRKVAGFRFSPTSADDVASGGFATDKDTIARLGRRCKRDTPVGFIAGEFCDSYSRYNALETYLSTFVAGIERNVGQNSILHTKLNQTITRTGRLSSSDPNFQNMPRGTTFPVKRAITSRFNGGCILEVDWSKLEYAVAVGLADDQVGKEDLKNNIDAHTLTAKILYELGEAKPTSGQRQDAKPMTFKPLYGGQSGTPKEQEYIKWFMEKHYGVAKWHGKLIREALETGRVVTPTGRIFEFPQARRTRTGYVIGTTSIVNYPVQSVATGDINPIAQIELRKEIIEKGLKSLMFLTVHDSTEIDVYPGELDDILDIINTVFGSISSLILARYGFDLGVSLGWETKVGNNWLEMKDLK